MLVIAGASCATTREILKNGTLRGKVTRQSNQALLSGMNQCQSQDVCEAELASASDRPELSN